MFIRRIFFSSLPHSVLLLPSSSPSLLLSTPGSVTAAAADLIHRNTIYGFRQSRFRPHRMMASSCRTTDGGRPPAFASLPPSTADKAELIRALESTLGSSFSSEPLIPPPNPQIIVISGPSGVGKDAVIKKLQEVRQGIHFVVTATSRAKRPGEVDGKDYHFVSKENFLSMIERNELLEYALVYGEYKGVPKQQIRDFMSKGFDIVLRVDIQGAATLRSILGRSAMFIFLVAESESALVERLIDRKTETTDMLLVRIAMAREEIKHVVDFDYVVVNAQGKLNETVKLVESIIDSEKAKVRPRSASGFLKELELLGHRYRHSDMKIRYKEAAVVVEKGVVVSFEAGYRAISAHPFLAVFVCFLYLLYCFLPGLFAFLANSSPVILCTTILLGALLSHGNPNIPDIDGEGEEPAAQDHGARSRSIFIEKEQERDGDSIGKIPENDVAVRQVEDDREKKVDDGGFVCLDPSSSSLHGLLLKKAVDVSGDASKSGSDGEESCSPDASMADIQPLLDELHPFFNPEICRPVRVNIDDSDDTSGTYSGDEESEVDSSSEEEEDEDASETRQLLKGAGHADDDEEDDDDSLDATAWNADDMRNFKDLKSSELERNRRLENLIAKRMARKNVTELGNFIDLDQSTLDRYSNLQISNVSKSKSNPFDDPEESNDLPPIPSSAPSVFSKRNNPFDFHQPFMPGRNFPSTDDTYRESATPGVGNNSYAQFQAELAGKDRSKLSTIPESEPDYIRYSSLSSIETSNVDAALREPLLSPDGQNLEENIMIQSMADDENEHVTTEAHSIAEFDVIPDHYLVCDVAKIAEPPLDESGVELPTDLSTDNEFKLSSSDSKYESLLSELDAVGDFSAPQNDQMFQQHSDSDQTGSYSNSNSNSDSDSTVEIEAASPKQHAESESGNESDSAAPKEGKEESKNIDSSSDSGTHKTSEVHSELHEAGDTHFVLIHDRESIEDKRENPTEEKKHTDDMDVDDDLSFSLPEDMDVALKRLFRQNTMKKKGLLEDGAESEKQQEDLHWELRRLFRQNTLKKRSNLDETEKQQQEEDFLSALTLLFKEKTTTFAQEKDNGDEDDDDDTAVQDMHMALKRLFRQFSFAPERSNVLKDEEDFELCDKKVEMDTVEMPMPNNLVQAEASPSSSDVSQFEQTSSEFVEISDRSQVAAVSDEHKQTDKLTESPDMIQENNRSENETVIVPEEEASQIPSKPHKTPIE